MGPDAMILVFLIFSFKLALYSPPSPSSRGSSVPLHFLTLGWYHLHIWGCWCFSHLSWFQLVTHPAQHFSWCAQPINKQGHSRQSCHTPFSIVNQSVVPYRVLTAASWPTNRFLRRQVRWSSIPISLRVFHRLLWSTQSKALSTVNETEVDVFLEFLCFLYNPVNIGNLISASLPFLNPAWTPGHSQFK